MKKQYPPIVWKLCSVAMYILGGFFVLMAIACFAATIFLSIPFILLAIFSFACAKSFAREAKTAKSKKDISRNYVRMNSPGRDLSESAACNKITTKARPIQTVKDLASIRSYVVLDTETTGLSRRNDRIIEIALICYDSGQEVNRFSSLINPGMPIPAAATRINHIRNSDVANAPSIADVMPTILQLIDGRIIIGHNITFDLGFLGYAMPKESSSIAVEYIDTLALARRAFPGRSSYKLADLVSELGISDTQEHRALGDVELTAKLFTFCCQELAEKHAKELAARRAQREQAKAEKLARFGWSPMINKNFVFTGDFQHDRNQLEEFLDQIGANLRDKVNGNTDYLVKGDVTNLPTWALERKYQKAVSLMQDGKKIKIITEREYLALVQDTIKSSPGNL